MATAAAGLTRLTRPGRRRSTASQVVTVLKGDACQAAFDTAPVCFVQTNTRSLAERDAPRGPRGLIAGPGGAVRSC